MKAYSEYKESGVEWIGKIPSYWNFISIKLLEGNSAEVVQTGPFGAQLHASDYQDEGIPLILIKHVNNLSISNLNLPKISLQKAEELSLYRLKKGDIVFSRVGSIGRIALVEDEQEGWLISGQMLRLRITNPAVYPRFAIYSITSETTQTYFQLSSVGSTRESINTEILRNYPIPIPPLPEQQAIADFLDRKTAQVDRLIEKKQRQIELLQEQRTALINQAVTKGLDPDVPMKDSGIEWLGEIPEHWDVLLIRYTARVGRGQTPRPAGDPRFFNGSHIPWITVGEVTKDKGMYLTETKTMLTEEGSKHSIIFKKGTLVLTNSGATLGVPKILGIDGCMNDGNAAFQNMRNDMEKKYMYFFFMSMTMILRDQSQVSGQPNLNTTIISSLNIPKPPLDEQKSIANFLIDQEENFKVATKKLTDTIELLQEYRTTLISAAVTGKIDVREVEA